MRGSDERTGTLFSYVDVEERVPADHPLRVIRAIVNEVLEGLNGEFARIYSDKGRPSIAPERLLRALLLQTFYTIRSERQLMEQLDYNLLYRWFVGLGVDEAVWVPTVFTKNRDRLLDAEVARKLLAELLNHEKVRKLLSDEHFYSAFRRLAGSVRLRVARLLRFAHRGGRAGPIRRRAPSRSRNAVRQLHVRLFQVLSHTCFDGIV